MFEHMQLLLYQMGGSETFNCRTVHQSFKGVLHPRPVFGLFLHFSQKLQHIGNK